MEQAPDDLWTRVLLLDLHEERGEDERALAQLLRIVELAPEEARYMIEYRHLTEQRNIGTPHYYQIDGIERHHHEYTGK